MVRIWILQMKRRNGKRVATPEKLTGVEFRHFNI